MLKITLLLFVSLGTWTLAKPINVRLDLTHVDSGRDFTKQELLQRMTLRTNTRATTIFPNYKKPTNPITPLVYPGNGDEPYDREYIAKFSIGTPPQPVVLTVDTGSDLIWTQCQPCLTCFDQGLPYYDPSNSTTFSYLSCSSDICTSLPLSSCHQQCFYLYEYGDGSATVGSVSSETFTFGPKKNEISVPNLGFGCGFLNGGIFVSNESGILGLGRGPVSLISQLGVNEFSYCFSSLFGKKSSPLLLGTSMDPYNMKIQSTPLIKNPTNPSFYYLSLKGITVGTTLLHIPPSAFALHDNGTGGVIIDSGTALTVLSDVAYQQVRKAFVHQIKLPVAKESMTYLDLCFSLNSSLLQSVQVPKLVFHFENVDLELPKENYIFEDHKTGELCLVITSSGDTSSIFGNFQQQNIQIVYDLADEKLSFLPALCDKL
ncbi:hypothetical protein LUZ60_001305 [Juncus effusus]|nr:hypothetical protein LUZ60_001305 [Juncus effusus]